MAAVDLGSNSFHMVVARLIGDRVQLVDRIKERVALAEGLDKKKRLSSEARARALACLERFGQRVAGLPVGTVRAVGTNTLRRARNGAEFLAEAQRALGHPIGIISGREEARLVYLGVAHSLPDEPGRRVVVDIGGGSTEIIVGEGFAPKLVDSLYMGCVSFTQRFFPDKRVTPASMDKAIVAARMEVEPIAERYRELGWSSAVGSSGTILAIASILEQEGWSEAQISRKALRRLAAHIAEVGDVDALNLPGLKEERKPVIAGGVAVLLGVFEELGIKRMRASAGALREGLLYDMLGRIDHEDVREATVASWMKRYHVNADQAARVAATAGDLFDQVAVDWELEGTEWRRFLTWAARLHEVGLSIGYSGHHRHGAYLVRNSDAPGFLLHEREALAALVRAHRRKVYIDDFDHLSDEVADLMPRLVALLRVAVRVHRSHRRDGAPPIRAVANDDHLRVELDETWLAEHPLTAADLDAERKALERIGIHLTLEPSA